MDVNTTVQVAILGATGYIGRAILDALHHDSRVSVVGYSRDVANARAALLEYHVSFDTIEDYRNLMDRKYDVLINATGVGSPKKLSQDPSAVFSVTEMMDQRIFAYLEKYPATRVFNLSSGAVYGKGAGDFVSPDSRASFAVNALSARDAYALAKLHSEVRHRSRSEYAIVDLRVFAFVSRFLDPNDSFLVSEIAGCLREGRTFHTKGEDMVRDYVTAQDIVAVIHLLLSKDPVNDVFDMKSRKAVGKFELLNELHTVLRLAFAIEDLDESSPTGAKNIYAPVHTRLEEWGYVPNQSSLENVVGELKAFLTV